jgi:hypothetical protein
MELESFLGAIVGFLLAQIVNLATLAYNRWRRPILVIEEVGDGNRILSHSTELNRGEWVDEVYYGFRVRNAGKRIALGVRCQLLKMEVRRTEAAPFRTVLDTATELYTYSGAGQRHGSSEATVIPGSSVDFELAWWREDAGVVSPSSKKLPDYLVESCGDAVEYRFTVVAFTGPEYGRKILTIEPGR